jgi:hypothetical protein
MESEAYRAKRDCWSPVPLITTSHCVSERDSMVRFTMDGGKGKEDESEKRRRRKLFKKRLARGFKLKRSGDVSC